MKKIRVVCVLLMLGFAVGCASVPVPPYQGSPDTVNQLQAAKTSKATIGDFSGKPEVQKLSARASTFLSPYNDSFSDYVKESLRIELTRAGLFDPSSSTVVEGTLLKNEVSVPSDTGKQEIEVRFIVRKKSNVVYDKVISIAHEWQSSFVGAVALPAARNAYPTAVNKLFSKLFADQDFLAALR